MYQLGWEQFVPFMVTIIAIVLTDLLTGIGLGLLVGLLFTLHHSYRNTYSMKDTKSSNDGRDVHHFVLAEAVSFFNKASIIEALEKVPANTKVIIDCTNCKSIAYDVVEFIHDYQLHAKLKNIEVETVNFKPPKHLLSH
jgi:MFS superfamily sulfate permease-like transporter